MLIGGLLLTYKYYVSSEVVLYDAAAILCEKKKPESNNKVSALIREI
jgi:hypothetical protein